jgi:hypothetical protein
MAKLTVNLKDITVSDMRRNLARVLSKMDGTLIVEHASFSVEILFPKRRLLSRPEEY